MIFGGAFDPPTLAHEAIIAACLRLTQFDNVWVMPSGDRVDKQMGSAAADRLAMLKAMHHSSFKGDSRLSISGFELALPQPSATYRTIQALKKQYPQTDFCFVFGRDSYINMPSWPHGKTLRQQLKMVVFASGLGPEVAAPNVTRLDIPAGFGLTSSTDVRKALQGGGKADNLPVSPAVMQYLKQHNLYRTAL